MVNRILSCPAYVPMRVLQPVYVMPSTSGRAATYPSRADKLKFFLELKELRDKRRMEKGLVPAEEECRGECSDHSAALTAADVRN